MMKRTVFLITVVLMGIFGCTNHLSIALGSGIVVTVGKDKVTLDEFRKRLNNFVAENGIKPGRISKDLVLTELDNVINTMLLLQEADKEGITVTAQEISAEYDQLKQGYNDQQFNSIFIEKLIDKGLWMKELEERLIVKKVFAKHFSSVSVPQADVEQYYNSHPDIFSVPEMVRARQMEFSSEDAAQKALDELNAGKSFTKVAQDYSIIPGAASGGDMGLLSAGDLPKELAGILFTLPVGKISGIMKTQFGYQIFLVEAKIPPHKKTLSEARSGIVETLKNEKMNSDFAVWIKTLKNREGVRINYELLKRAGLI